MKITMINGSPKAKNSASESLLSILKGYCNLAAPDLVLNKIVIEEENMAEIWKSDALVIAFPLYIDSVPSHLLRCLIQIEEYARLHGQERTSEETIKVYVVINNGFFQGKQNMPAIEVMQHWTKRCGFEFGQAVGVGGGGMINFIKNVPDGHGPKKNLTVALREMAGNILQKKSGETKVFELNYPAWAYKWQAEYGWRMAARKNGLKSKDLNKRA